MCSFFYLKGASVLSTTGALGHIKKNGSVHQCSPVIDPFMLLWIVKHSVKSISRRVMDFHWSSLWRLIMMIDTLRRWWFTATWTWSISGAGAINSHRCAHQSLIMTAAVVAQLNLADVTQVVKLRQAYFLVGRSLMSGGVSTSTDKMQKGKCGLLFVFYEYKINLSEHIATQELGRCTKTKSVRQTIGKWAKAKARSKNMSKDVITGNTRRWEIRQVQVTRGMKTNWHRELGWIHNGGRDNWTQVKHIRAGRQQM